MGNLFNWFGTNKELEEKAREILREKEKEIIDYFNSKGILEKPNGKSDDDSLNMDKAIEKIFYPGENRYNLHLRIYNIPGIFRRNDGLFEIIGQTLMIFQLFFNKYNSLEKELLQQKFYEFFDALMKADSAKIYDIIGLQIEDCDLIKKKEGLESLLEIFGVESFKSYWESVFKVHGIGTLAFSGGVGLVAGYISSSLTAAIATPLAIIIISGFLGYCIYQRMKEKHIQNVKNNVTKIQDFYDEIQRFISGGPDYFCIEKKKKDGVKDGEREVINYKDSEKNLFVIAYEKQSDNSVKEICMFPYYIRGLSGKNCPTIGKNTPMDSNAGYYRAILNACKYYVDTFHQRIFLHINGNLQPNLQSEIEYEFNLLKKANEKAILKVFNKEIINGGMTLNSFEEEERININTNNVSMNTNLSDQEDGNQQFEQQYEQQEENDNRNILACENN